LDEVVELKGHTGVIKVVLWDPAGNSDYVVSLDENNIRVFDLETNFTNPKASRTIPSNGRLFAGAMDPLHANLMAVANETSIKGYDFRAPKEAYSIDKAHSEGVRDIDFNPNKAYYLASGGDDCKLKFWDVRNVKEPVKVFTGHSHWIWCVRYNRYHDQLVITSSSDHLVKLWNIESISSARDDEEESHKPKRKKEDSLIKTFEEHEDSVYSVAWGTSNWLFASLSYDGRVVINYVPKEYADILKY